MLLNGCSLFRIQPDVMELSKVFKTGIPRRHIMIAMNHVDVGSIGKLSRPWKRKDIKRLLTIDPLDRESRYSKCISLEETEADFFVCNNPRCSSLFEPNWDFLSKFFGKIDKQYRVKKVIKVQCCRLDSILEKEEEEYDFLKTDAQGADLHVIQSSGEFLNQFVGVHCEAFFHPFYKGIPLFDDYKKYLESKGFILYATIATASTWGDYLFINKNSKKTRKIRRLKKMYKRYQIGG